VGTVDGLTHPSPPRPVDWPTDARPSDRSSRVTYKRIGKEQTAPPPPTATETDKHRWADLTLYIRENTLIGFGIKKYRTRMYFRVSTAAIIYDLRTRTRCPMNTTRTYTYGRAKAVFWTTAWPNRVVRKRTGFDVTYAPVYTSFRILNFFFRLAITIKIKLPGVSFITIELLY